VTLEQLRIFVAVAEREHVARRATSQSDLIGDERRNRSARGALSAVGIAAARDGRRASRRRGCCGRGGGGGRRLADLFVNDIVGRECGLGGARSGFRRRQAGARRGRLDGRYQGTHVRRPARRPQCRHSELPRLRVSSIAPARFGDATLSTGAVAQSSTPRRAWALKFFGRPAALHCSRNQFPNPASVKGLPNSVTRNVRCSAPIASIAIADSPAAFTLLE